MNIQKEICKKIRVRIKRWYKEQNKVVRLRKATMIDKQCFYMEKLILSNESLPF